MQQLVDLLNHAKETPALLATVSLGIVFLMAVSLFNVHRHTEH